MKSATLVGSHGDLNKPFEKTNDFDILLIFEKFGPNELKQVQLKLNELVDKLSNPDCKVWTEYRIGPVKATYDTSEPMGIMLHLLLFGIESFRAYQEAGPFATFDWSKYTPLFGESLENLFIFSFPSKEQLLHAKRHSIDFYEKMLSEKSYILVDISDENGSLVSKTKLYPFSENQLPELFSDIIKKILINIIIVFDHQNKIWDDNELIKRAIKLLPNLKEREKDLQNILSLKKRIRSGETISDNAPLELITRKLIESLKEGISAKQSAALFGEKQERK